jgi:hypothetical protein
MTGERILRVSRWLALSVIAAITALSCFAAQADSSPREAKSEALREVASLGWPAIHGRLSKGGLLLEEFLRVWVYNPRAQTPQTDHFWLVGFRELYDFHGRGLRRGDTYLAVYSPKGKLTDWKGYDRLDGIEVYEVNSRGNASWAKELILVRYFAAYDLVTIGESGALITVLQIDSEVSDILIQDINDDAYPELLIPFSSEAYNGGLWFGDRWEAIDDMVPGTPERGLVIDFLDYPELSVSRMGILEFGGLDQGITHIGNRGGGN